MCAEKTWGQMLVPLPAASLGALGKLLNLSEHCLSHLYPGRLPPGLTGLF